MRKKAEYAVARHNGAIVVSLDEAENLVERRSSTDSRDASDRSVGRVSATHKRRATDQPHSGARQQAHEAGGRVRGLMSRAWHSLFPARGARDDSSAP